MQFYLLDCKAKLNKLKLLTINMINLFKKVKNLLPSSEKAWYTLG